MKTLPNPPEPVKQNQEAAGYNRCVESTRHQRFFSRLYLEWACEPKVRGVCPFTSYAQAYVAGMVTYANLAAAAAEGECVEVVPLAVLERRSAAELARIIESEHEWASAWLDKFELPAHCSRAAFNRIFMGGLLYAEYWFSRELSSSNIARDIFSMHRDCHNTVQAFRLTIEEVGLLDSFRKMTCEKRSVLLAIARQHAAPDSVFHATTNDV